MKKNITMFIALILMFSLCGCSANRISKTSQKNAENTKTSTDTASSSTDGFSPAANWTPETIEIPGLTYEGRMKLSYADQFCVDYYQDGYALIQTAQNISYFYVPKSTNFSVGTYDIGDLNLKLIHGPISHGYLAATAAMDMFVSLDALDCISFSSLPAEDWFIQSAKEATEKGRISYAGKYSAPDYEKLLSGSCDIAIENTMIFHSPAIKEELEKFNIPVLVDLSSYEKNPLGRMEWIKLYGLLTDHNEQALRAFSKQEAAYLSAGSDASTGKSVAFFYITGNGTVNVRKSSDYMAKMIQAAGGNYIFSDLGSEDETAKSTISMTMEEFYAAAKDADYMIYNSTIEGELSSVQDLLGKNSLLQNCKAVQTGNVFCTTQNTYQCSMSLGSIVQDLHYMMLDEDEKLTYLYRLK